MDKIFYSMLGAVLALAAAPALAQTPGDTQTVTIGPVTGQSSQVCVEIFPPLSGNCVMWTTMGGSASIGWSPDPGWVIAGTPLASSSGTGNWSASPLALEAGGGSYIAQRNLRRAYAIALKMANLGGKTDVAKALEIERQRLFAAYAPNGSVANTIEMTGNCTPGIDSSTDICTVTISATTNLVYVGPDDPFALLVSLMQRFKL